MKKNGKKVAGIGTVILMSATLMVNSATVCAEEYEYDSLNRVTKVTYDDGSFVTYSYDKNGNIVSEEVGDGVVVTVNNNFWLRIVAFFKYTLFRMNNVVSFN